MLVAAVVGSGIMAQRLTDDIAVALLCNSIATGAILIVLIAVLGPLSGAHLNPAVSLVFALRRELKASEALLYMLVQVAAGIAGALIAHVMFELPLVSASLQPRTGGGQWLSEAIAAFGLVFVILAGSKVDRRSVPWLVGLFIASAYWFTASTSFANPAVTVARPDGQLFRHPPRRRAWVRCRPAGRRVLRLGRRDVAIGGRQPAHRPEAAISPSMRRDHRRRPLAPTSRRMISPPPRQPGNRGSTRSRGSLRASRRLLAGVIECFKHGRPARSGYRPGHRPGA